MQKNLLQCRILKFSDLSVNIVHLGKYYPPDRGGMESFLQALAKAQVQHGHTVNVLAHTTELNTKSGVTMDCGVRVRRCKVAFNVGSYAPVAPALFLHSLPYLLHDSHIIHAHSPNIASLYSLFALGRPVILHWHSDVIFPRKSKNMPPTTSTNAIPVMHLSPKPLLPAYMIRGWRALEKLCLHKATCIVTTSQAYLDTSEFLQAYRHKCRVIPLALGEAVQPDYNNAAVQFLQNKNMFSVLATGRLSHYKGFDTLIKALVHIPDACLCLVGLGECEAYLRLLVQKYGLGERVYFAGNISESVLRACYQACQCFVLPSILRTEAFGMVLLEAMRESKPCIVSNVTGSGMTTVLLHGKTGLLYQSGDVLALVAALKTLMVDENLCMSMGQNGYERWKSEYNIDSVCAAFDAIYNEFSSITAK